MSNPHDDDPFADNPDAEYAPTQAMTSVPVREDLREDGAATPAPTATPSPSPAAAPVPGPSAGPQGPRPAGAGPVGPKPYGTSGRPHAVPEPKKFGISAVLSLVSGLLIIASFLLPSLSMAWFFETVMEERGGAADFEVFSNLPDGEFSASQKQDLEVFTSALAFESARQPMFKSVGIDRFIEDLSEANSGAEVVEAIEGYDTSMYGAMEVFRTLDTDGDQYDADKEQRAGGRIIWTSLAWIPLTGLVAVLLVLIRVFKPLNALQIGWNGLFGFMWTNGAVAMLVFNPPSRLFDVSLFQGSGVYVFAAGAVMMWVSAFAGLTSKNWWKAPLIALGLLLVMGASIVVPAFLLAA